MHIIKCPHCNEYIIIDKIRCGIFRHAIYKHNGKQINPHTKKEICDKLVENNKIHGCCKPFSVKIKNNCIVVEKCDYI